jgi:ADP-heptose:LPS heptosyltransferase
VTPTRILVIKLGALGDIVQALGPAAAIRTHHATARIVLLTAAPFAEFLARAPYFDEVWIDERPGLANLRGLFRLRRRLLDGRFDRIYDLQTSSRSSFYYRLIGPGRRPEWSGIAIGCSHPHDNPQRDSLHTIDRQADQLRRAGIVSVPLPDLSWAAVDMTRFDLPERIMVLVPGGAAHRPEKRWKIERYAAIARFAAALGVVPVVIGGPGERGLGAAIASVCPEALDLTGRTELGDIVSLGQRALWAIGNDTGPMHLLVGAGAPATVLYSSASDPALTAPRGKRITILRRRNLDELAVEEVAATLPFG